MTRFTYLFEHVPCGRGLFLQPHASPDVRTFHGGLNRSATPELDKLASALKTGNSEATMQRGDPPTGCRRLDPGLFRYL